MIIKKIKQKKMEILIAKKIFLVSLTFVFGVYLFIFIKTKQGSTSMFNRFVFKLYTLNYIELFVVFATAIYLFSLSGSIILVFLLKYLSNVFDAYSISSIDFSGSYSVNIYDSSSATNMSNVIYIVTTPDVSTTNAHNTTNFPNISSSRSYNNAANALIMGAALLRGAKIAPKAQGLLGSIAAFVVALAAGGAGIIIKSAVGNLNKDIGSI